MIEKIIILILQLKIVQQLLYDLYLWQLKEYRLDRVKEHLQRTNKNDLIAWENLTLTAPFSIKKLPKFTPKALILFFISLLLLLIMSTGGLITLLWALIATPGLIIISLYCIKPIEWAIRYLVYFLASKKLQKLQKRGLIVIGITGSYGKTTAKSFIHQLLSSKFKILSTAASINTPLGISLIILKQLNTSHKFFLVEMGAYKKGEILELCRIAHPNIAIITGISNQHLALFGSQENIIAAKSEILENLDKDSIAIVNKSSKFLPEVDQKRVGKVIFYGLPQTNKLYRKFKELAVVPEFLKINLEPALILAKLYKIGDSELKKAINNLNTLETVVKTTKGIKNATIINDSRSSNFNGVMAALDYLQSLKSKNKIVIMSCLIELGPDASKDHHQIGQKLARVANLVIITTDDFFESIKSGGGNSEKIILIKDSDQIVKKLKSVINSDTAILIEGRVDQKLIDYYV